MSLPPIHNKRASEQWDIISSHIDFEDKTILDMGCGYGDILFRCWAAGANIWAIEPDEETRLQLWKRRQEIKPKPDGGESYYFGSIESYMIEQHISYDIIICFSVLPYLKRPFEAIQWIKDHSEIALIECQYSGDGPGFEMILKDDDMKRWLSLAGWQSMEPIGKTLVEDRQRYRTIWLCR